MCSNMGHSLVQFLQTCYLFIYYLFSLKLPKLSCSWNKMSCIKGRAMDISAHQHVLLYAPGMSTCVTKEGLWDLRLSGNVLS